MSATVDAVRIAVVGAGRMGAVHLRAVAESGAAVVAAIVDPDPAARERGDTAGAKVFDTVAALLAADGVDAAIVAVPTHLHADVCLQLLSAGVPTLCEKPAGLDAGTTRRLAGEAARRGTPLRVGYWRRFVPALSSLREAIATGAFGPVSLIVSAQWDHRPPPAAFRRSSGGIVIDMGVHEIDQVRWLTGQEFATISWTSSTIRVDPEVDHDPESGVITAQLSGGAIALVTLGRAHPVGDLCQVEVLGPDSAVREEFLRPADGDRAFVDAVARQAQAFASSVGGADWTGASIDDAVATLEVAERVTALMAGGAG